MVKYLNANIQTLIEEALKTPYEKQVDRLVKVGVYGDKELNRTSQKNQQRFFTFLLIIGLPIIIPYFLILNYYGINVYRK